MKKAFVLAILAFSLIFQMGCAKVGIAGGPQVYTGGGILRGGLFPPQLLLLVKNTTPAIVTVEAYSAVEQIHARIIMGQTLRMPFRQLSAGCRDVSVVASAYDPKTGFFIASRDRNYNVCGGQNNTQTWLVRLSGDQRSYTLQ